MPKRPDSVDEWLERAGASKTTREKNKGLLAVAGGLPPAHLGGPSGEPVAPVSPELLQFPTEAALQAFVVKQARSKGYLAYHTHNSKHSDKGFPDCVILGGGRLIVAELKVRKGWPNPAQRLYLDAFVEARAETYLWLDGDGQAILNVLNGYLGEAGLATLWTNRKAQRAASLAASPASE